MIKVIFHKTFSAILALLVMFSTVSFAIEKHYCGDVLVNVSVFTEVDKCGMEGMEMLQKKKCCKDQIDVVEGQDELKTVSFEDLDFEQQQFIASFVYSFSNLFESLPKEVIPHKDYSPPNLICDIQVLDQVFLI